MRARFSFGDPVIVVTDPGAGHGLIAELRRADCRVLYLRPGRSLWVPLHGIRAARGAEIAGTLEEEVARLLSRLGAAELEVSMPAAGRCRLIASHGAIRPESVDAVRELLGERLASYSIRPQGMRRIQTILEFVIDPGPGASAPR